MTDAQARAQAAQKLVNAYHRTLKTEDGAAVLADLKASFGFDFPAFFALDRGGHSEFDPIHAAIRDGQRQVILHVLAKLSAPVSGENEVKAKRSRVKK
jgi:hypothetical protein